MRRAIVLVIMVAALLTIGNGKENVMGLGWEQWGRGLGYSQQQWDALPQGAKDRYKMMHPQGYTGTGVPQDYQAYSPINYAATATAEPAPTMDYVDDGSGR